MGEKLEQRPRISYTIGYKGIVVGGMNQYHPEKMDISMTMTIDHLEGESKIDTNARLAKLKDTEKLLVEVVGSSVVEKVNAIKQRFHSSVENLSHN